MARVAAERIHSLEIPISQTSLLIPSASIAEVVNLSDIVTVPFGQPWLIGAMGWRMLAVPVISFDGLLGWPTQPPQLHSKLVIFYPMPGRKQWEFFGLLSSAEPRPHAVDSGNSFVAAGTELPASPYVASGLKIGGRLMLIPNLETVRQLFYGQ